MRKREKTRSTRGLNRMRNHTAEGIKEVYTTTILFFVPIQLVLSEFLPGFRFWCDTIAKDEVVSKLIAGILMLVEYALEAGLCVALFMMIKACKNRKIIKEHAEFDLAGKWYHVHIPHTLGSPDYSRGLLRAGETTINRDLYDFTFDACNYNYQMENGKVCMVSGLSYTSWSTVISEVAFGNNDYNVIEIYRANSNEIAQTNITECPCCHNKPQNPVTINEAPKERYGVHRFIVEDLDEETGKYNKIRAPYSDCWPSMKTGELLLFRKQTERDACIEQYFAGQ